MPLQKTWRISSPNPSLQKRLAEALGISWVTAQILINRGIDEPEKVQAFLKPSLKDLPNPFLFPDMEKAVRRLIQAIQNRESIAVYGDYDVDGLTSSALLQTFFTELSLPLTVYIPDRIQEGYGINIKALEELKAKKISLIITADCGTKSQDALQWAKKNGLDVIVTDHHELDSRKSPAFAFINPQMLKEGTPGRELAGVGVVFMLLIALRQKMREECLFKNGEPNLRQHLDLVALGTVGDLAPLTGINRILVTYGLKELAVTKKMGIIALKEVCKLDGGKTMEQSDIGFRLAPRINAGGRIAKASLGLDLLCAADLERASKLAKILDQCNQERQAMQEKHVREAFRQAEDKLAKNGFVVSSKDWHPGIVGLVASKLAENYYRPSIALAIEKDFARGSARSIPGVHIVEILEACSDLLEQFGGHKQAAGLTVSLTNLSQFEERFEKALQQKVLEEPFKPFLNIDCELKLNDIQAKFLEELGSLKPFGIKNPEPVFACNDLKFNDLRVVGEKHLKFKVTDLENTLEAIGFNMSNNHPLTLKGGNVAFVPQWNTYQNQKTIQLKIKDLKRI